MKLQESTGHPRLEVDADGAHVAQELQRRLFEQKAQAAFAAAARRVEEVGAHGFERLARLQRRHTSLKCCNTEAAASIGKHRKQRASVRAKTPTSSDNSDLERIAIARRASAVYVLLSATH